MRTVKNIDRSIARVYRKLHEAEKIDVYSAASWQAAWDKHPDLYKKVQVFYFERSLAKSIIFF
jgi:hypothetical protein